MESIGEARVQNRRGLHARPFSRIVEAVQASRSRVLIKTQGEEADASSLLQLMRLTPLLEQYATVHIEARGDDAPAVVAAIKDIVHEAIEEVTDIRTVSDFPYADVYSTARGFRSCITVTMHEIVVDATAGTSKPSPIRGIAVANEKIWIVACGEDAGEAAATVRALLAR